MPCNSWGLGAGCVSPSGKKELQLRAQHTGQYNALAAGTHTAHTHTRIAGTFRPCADVAQDSVALAGIALRQECVRAHASLILAVNARMVRYQVHERGGSGTTLLVAPPSSLNIRTRQSMPRTRVRRTCAREGARRHAHDGAAPETAAKAQATTMQAPTNTCRAHSGGRAPAQERRKGPFSGSVQAAGASSTLS